jgi:hypothetical protein
MFGGQLSIPIDDFPLELIEVVDEGFALDTGAAKIMAPLWATIAMAESVFMIAVVARAINANRDQ